MDVTTRIVRTINNKAGHQIGYEVYDVASEKVIATFKNRDFGGVAFWRRAKDAAYNVAFATEDRTNDKA